MAQSRGGLTEGPDAAALLAALPSAMVVVDEDGCIATVNAAAEVLLNASAANLRHKPLGVVLRLPPECLDGVREDALFAAFDCTVSTPRGTSMQVDVHAAPLPDYPGWRLLTLASSSAASVGLRRDRSRSAMGAAAMLAHEIKNPLSGIRGAAQLLEPLVSADGVAMTRLIRDEVDRVAALIDRMEAFTDARPLETRAENIYSIIEHARAAAELGFQDRISISDAYDPSLPFVLAHRDSMIQVLLNLIKNAAEVVPDGERGHVVLQTKYRHGISVATGERRRALPIELCVIDDGPGPSPEIADHLFEPFVTSKASGRGLGLALVDKLVRANGGIVQFAREGSPARSVFRILLPRAE